MLAPRAFLIAGELDSARYVAGNDCQYELRKDYPRVRETSRQSNKRYLKGLLKFRVAAQR